MPSATYGGAPCGGAAFSYTPGLTGRPCGKEGMSWTSVATATTAMPSGTAARKPAATARATTADASGATTAGATGRTIAPTGAGVTRRSAKPSTGSAASGRVSTAPAT